MAGEWAEEESSAFAILQAAAHLLILHCSRTAGPDRNLSGARAKKLSDAFPGRKKKHGLRAGRLESAHSRHAEHVSGRSAAHVLRRIASP